MQVESKLFQVGCKLLNAHELENGDIDDKTFSQWWTQCAKTGSIKDLKKRMLDILNAAGYRIDYDDVRLWVHNSEESVDESSLSSRCKQVQDGFKTAVEVDGSTEE